MTNTKTILFSVLEKGDSFRKQCSCKRGGPVLVINMKKVGIWKWVNGTYIMLTTPSSKKKKTVKSLSLEYKSEIKHCDGLSMYKLLSSLKKSRIRISPCTGLPPYCLVWKLLVFLRWSDQQRKHTNCYLTLRENSYLTKPCKSTYWLQGRKCGKSKVDLFHSFVD